MTLTNHKVKLKLQAPPCKNYRNISVWNIQSKVLVSVDS